MSKWLFFSDLADVLPPFLLCDSLTVRTLRKVCSVRFAELYLLSLETYSTAVITKMWYNLFKLSQHNFEFQK